MTCIVKIVGDKEVALSLLRDGCGCYVSGNPETIKEGKVALRIKIGKKRRFLQGKLSLENGLLSDGSWHEAWYFEPNSPLQK